MLCCAERRISSKAAPAAVQPGRSRTQAPQPPAPAFLKYNPVCLTSNLLAPLDFITLFETGPRGNLEVVELGQLARLGLGKALDLLYEALYLPVRRGE